MSQSYGFRAGALSGQRWPSSWRAGATFIFDRWRLTMSYSGCVSTAQVAPWGVRLLLHPPGTSQACCWPRFGVNSISNSSAHPAPLSSCLVSCCIDHNLFTTTRHGRHPSVFHPPPSCTRTYSPPEEQSERLDESREKSSLTFKWTPNGREASIVRSPRELIGVEESREDQWKGFRGQACNSVHIRSISMVTVQSHGHAQEQERGRNIGKLYAQPLPQMET